MYSTVGPGVQPRTLCMFPSASPTLASGLAHASIEGRTVLVLEPQRVAEPPSVASRAISLVGNYMIQT